MHRNGGREGCQGQQGIKQDGDDVAYEGHGGECPVENIGQGDEDERGAAVRTYAHRKGCGEYHQSGKNGYQRVDESYLYGRTGQIGLTGKVGGIGAEAGGAQAEGEEGLPEGFKQHAPVHSPEIGLEQKLDALRCTRKQTGGHHDDHEQHEERGHEQLGGPLDAVSHTIDNHSVGDENENDGPKDRPQGMGGKLLEIGLHESGVTTQLSGHRGIEILQAPAGHDGIETEDNHRGEHAHVAYHGPRFAARKIAVGAGGIGRRVPPDDELAHHARYAEQEDAPQIDQDEGRTAVMTGHIGEAPDVAQPHGRTGRGEDDAQPAAEIASCLHLQNAFQKSELMENDEQYAQRADETDEEKIGAEERSAQRAPVGELVFDDVAGHIPAHEDTGEQSAHGQENLPRHEVEHIEKGSSEHRETAHGAQRERADGTDEARGHGDDDGTALARNFQLFIKERGAHLVEGHERRKGRQREQGIEQQGDGPAHKGHRGESHVEDVGQGDKDERGAAVGVHAHGEGCGEYHQSGKHGHQRVDHGHLQGRLEQIGLPREVGGIGADATHGDAERIERLPQRTQKHAAIHLAKVRFEQEGDAFSGPGKQAGGHHDDEQKDEKCGHEQLGGSLYASAHTVDNHEMGDEKDGDRPEDRPHGITRKLVEIPGHKVGIALQFAHHRSVDVLQAPARNHGIVARDDKPGEHTHVAHPLPRTSTRKFGVGPSGIGGSVAAYDELTHHAGDAQKQDASQIDDDEGRTSVLPHHIRETPHVAQSNGSAGRGQYQSEFTSETRSILLCHISIFILFRIKSCKSIKKILSLHKE